MMWRDVERCVLLNIHMRFNDNSIGQDVATATRREEGMGGGYRGKGERRTEVTKWVMEEKGRKEFRSITALLEEKDGKEAKKEEGNHIEGMMVAMTTKIN